MSSNGMIFDSAHQGWLSAAAGTLGDRLRRLAGTGRARRDAERLHAMSDSELADIGIGRQQIEDAVHGRLARRR